MVKLAKKNDHEVDQKSKWRKAISEALPHYMVPRGHSLMAIKMMNNLEKETGKRIPLTALFQGPKVEKLASLIDKKDHNWDSFVPIKSTQHLNQFEFSNSWEIRSFKIDKYTTGSVAYPPSIVNTKFFIMNIEPFE